MKKQTLNTEFHVIQVCEHRDEKVVNKCLSETDAEQWIKDHPPARDLMGTPPSYYIRKAFVWEN